MKKFILTVNCIPSLTFGMNNKNENNINCILEKNINNTTFENSNINNITFKNSNINGILEENNFNSINNILKKGSINYDEYKILLNFLENKDLDILLKEKILEKIEEDNIIKSSDIEYFFKIENEKNNLKSKIDEEVEFINNVFKGKFFYKFSKNIDICKIYLIIHSIYLILNRNKDINNIISTAFDKMDCKFVLSDFNLDICMCDKIDEVLKEYKIKSNFTSSDKNNYGKIKDIEFSAFVSIIKKFFTINFENDFLTKYNYNTREYISSILDTHTISDDLINLEKYKDKQQLTKIVDIVFTTLHEFNHFILAIIKSLKNKKIEDYIIYNGKIQKEYQQINNEIKEEYIEKFKYNNDFKVYYEDISSYINYTGKPENILKNKNDEEFIKNYTWYSLSYFDKKNNIVNVPDPSFIQDLLKLKEIKEEFSNIKEIINKYEFLKYLYSLGFLKKNCESDKNNCNEENYNEIYEIFLFHYNNIFKSEDDNLDKKRKIFLLDFYKFLLHYKFNFNDINNFNIYIYAFIKGVSKHLESLKKEFNIIKDYKTNVNILECFADVFAIFYMPFKMPEKMRSLGIWQKYIFKYFSEKV